MGLVKLSNGNWRWEKAETAYPPKKAGGSNKKDAGVDEFKAFLNLIQTHQVDDSGQKGGGDPTDSSSASLAKPNTQPNSFINWLYNNAIQPTGQAIGDYSGINEFMNAINAPKSYISKNDPNVPTPVGRGEEALAGILEIPALTMGDKGADEEPVEPAPGESPILDAQGNPIKKFTVNQAATKPQIGEEPQYANDNQATEDLNPNAEKVNTTGKSSNTQGNQTPRNIRSFPANGEIPPEDVTENIKRNIPLDTHDVKTTDQQEQVNATYNGYGIKGSQRAQLAMSEDTVSDLSAKAKNAAVRSEDTIDKEKLVTSITKGLQSSAKTHNISLSRARIVASEYVDNAYARAKGVDLDSNIAGITPKKIPLEDALDMKTKAMNPDAKSTYAQENPTEWTEGQVTSRYARDAIDKEIDNTNKDVARYNNDASDLIKGQKGLRKGANAEAVQQRKDVLSQEANAPKRLTGNKILDSILRGTGKTVTYPATHPKQALELGALATILGSGIYAYKESQSQQQTSNFSSIKTNLPSLSQITTPTGNPLMTDLATYQDKKIALNNQLNAINQKEQQYTKQAEEGFYTPKSEIDNLNLQKSEVNNQLNSLETQYSAPNKLYTLYQKTSSQLTGLKQAQELIKNANPQWFQALGPLGSQITALRASVVPGYGAFLQHLNDIHEQTGIDVSAIIQADNKANANKSIIQAAQDATSYLKTQIQANGGSWPGTTGSQQTDSINQSINTLTGGNSGINTGNNTLNNILSPTPAPLSPTPTNTPQASAPQLPQASQFVLP